MRSFLDDEKPLLAPLPASCFELSGLEDKPQFSLIITYPVDGMLYSVPYEYIKKQS